MEINKKKRQKLTGGTTAPGGPGGYWRGMNTNKLGGGINISGDPKKK